MEPSMPHVYREDSRRDCVSGGMRAQHILDRVDALRHLDQRANIIAIEDEHAYPRVNCV
jgi:hypothetical protein